MQNVIILYGQSFYMCSTMQIYCQTECPYMVKQCNIYVQLINYSQVWFQNYISVWPNCAIKYLMPEVIINHTQMHRYLHKGTKYTSRPWRSQTHTYPPRLEMGLETGILQNLDRGLWTGPWTGLWTGAVTTITSRLLISDY